VGVFFSEHSLLVVFIVISMNQSDKFLYCVPSK